MSEKSKGDAIIGGSDMSESDGININILNEQQFNENAERIDSPILMRPDKRGRSDSGKDDVDGDEGFTTVERRRKRLARSSTQINVSENLYEISITSLEILPKQISLAKFLRSLSIPSILKVKYKSPYKVIVTFASKNDADILLNCPKLVDLGYRCQFTHEINLAYGIVKQVELEVNDEELQKIFVCDCEIVSVKRLKRLTEDGKWIDSETVRLSFRSSTLPSYVYAYGCRLKVERFIFPVTQCSRCWHFGHLMRACPTRKIICPKCGENHVNCETKSFRCVNCKGPHISLDKSCPVFKKEKEIRRVMSEEGVTYRKALEYYLEKEKDQNQVQKNYYETTAKSQTADITTHKLSYRDILVSQIYRGKANKEANDTKSEFDTERIQEMTVPGPTRRKKKKKRRQMSKEWTLDSEETQSEQENSQEEEMGKRKRESTAFSFKRCWLKLKAVFLADISFEEKIKSVMKIVWEELSSVLIKLVGEGFLQNILKYIFNG
ncbi:uncharacterized protein LOC120625008 [Pararge aegeria]|uniref:uncharacterized protein LOC120625008 n=1 Tax=Pararge aegeria TaxID=116150 RepID=UPI0019D167C5|nr:uncharacterized protein LOC120625008 [Pararge aegeria]